jgi:predicted AAA+ superfamily ATPase
VQLVIGPAGVGKSSYCKIIQEHGIATKRTIHVANLDPAAENFEYNAAFDVKELISLEQVLELD